MPNRLINSRANPLKPVHARDPLHDQLLMDRPFMIDYSQYVLPDV
jgi:hypothetical protein